MIVLKAHRKPVETLAFSPDGSMLLSTGDEPGCKMTSTANFEEIWSANPDGGISSATFAPNGEWVASCDGYTGIQIRESTTGRNLALLSDETRYSNYDSAIIAVTPNGKQLLVSGLTDDWHAMLHWWKTNNWKPSNHWASQYRTQVFYQAVFSKDGTTLVTIDFLSVREWDVDTGQVLWSLPIPVCNGVATVALSPNGHQLVYAGGPTLNVLDMQSKTTVATLQSSLKHVQRAAFSPDGRFLCSVSNDATVVFWDTSTWREDRRFAWKIGELKSFAFSPDGCIAAAGSAKGKIVVWDVD